MLKIYRAWICVLFIIGFSLPSFAAFNCIPHVRELSRHSIPTHLRMPETDREYAQRLFNIEFNTQSDSRIERNLAKNLNAGDREALIQFFKAELKKTLDTAPPAFKAQAKDNWEHILQHLEAIDELGPEGFKKEFNVEDGQTLYDLIVIQTLAHDLGKVGYSGNLISDKLRRAYDEIFKSLGPQENAVPKSPRFFHETIMLHGITSMDIIESLIQKFGKFHNWSNSKVRSVTSDLQLSTARHNAGYGPVLIDGKNPKEEFHFWHTKWNETAKFLRDAGYSGIPEIPPASRGLMQSFLAVVDRGTASSASFVQRVSSEGSLGINIQALTGFLIGNGNALGREMASIMKELNKYRRDPSSELPFMIRFHAQAAGQVKLAEKLRQDFEDPSRPRDLFENESIHFKKEGFWYRIRQTSTNLPRGILELYSDTEKKWLNISSDVPETIVALGPIAILLQHLLQNRLP